MKYFAFRFDVDTLPCIRKGVPNLIGLSQRYKVPFTFFVNMGKSTSRRVYIQRLISHSRQQDYKRGKQTNKLPLIKKLGLVDYLVTAAFNPSVGKAFLNNIKLIHNYGSEVGLHGGLNHALWQRGTNRYTREKIHKEINTALEYLNKIQVKSFGFASPGWNGGQVLNSVLEDLNFSYVSDIFGEDFSGIKRAFQGSNLLQVPVNIAGKLGEGYIESLDSQRFSDDQIIFDFRNKISNKDLAIVYDHPCYAGVKRIAIVERMIKKVKSQGFAVTTINDIVKKYRTALVG